MFGRVRRGGSRVAVLAIVVAMGVPLAPAEATGMAVLPGYDLFRTLPGTRVGVRLPGAPDTAMRFTSEPLGQFTFGGSTVATGGADTVVRRLDTATPEDGLVRVELVALQMRSYQPVGYFVTLQSDRGRNPLDPPDGPPSVGTLDIAFDPDGLGGTFESKFAVSYDIRADALDGPIVASGTAPIADSDVWQHARNSAPAGSCHAETVAIAHCIGVDTEDLQVCSTTTSAPIPALPGVDTLLNGSDESGDFHPFSTPGSTNDESLCVGGNEVTARCAFDTFANDFVTGGGDTFTGGAKGYAIAGTPGSSISVHCEVRVNGAAAATTPPGGAGQASYTVGQVTYTATWADRVELCAVWYGTESGERCGWSTD